MFIAPLKNVKDRKPEAGELKTRIGDSLIIAGESNLIRNFIERRTRKLGEEVKDVWRRWAFKLQGWVDARTFAEARSRALAEARFLVDWLVFEQQHGLSFLSGESGPHFWEREWTFGSPRLGDYLLLQDLNVANGPSLLHQIVPHDFLQTFTMREEFLRKVSEVGFFKQLSSTEATALKESAQLPPNVITKLRSAIYWYASGRIEDDLRNRLLSLWFGFEQLLASETYTNLFEKKENRAIRDQLTKAIRNIEIPEGASIDRSFLLDRINRGDPSLQAKLEEFADRFSAPLSETEIRIVRKFRRIRGELVHGKGSQPQPPKEIEFRQFEFVFEKMMVYRLKNHAEAEATILEDA